MNTFSFTRAIICAVLLGVCSLAATEPMPAQTTPAGIANLARYRQMFTLSPGEGLDFRPDSIALSGAAVPAVHFVSDGRVIVAGSGTGGRLFTATSNNGTSYIRLTAANGLSSFNDGSVIYLPDGRFRYIVQEASPTSTTTKPRTHIASFISTDGLLWTKESGVRYQPGIADDSVSGVPYCLQVQDSVWRLYYAGDLFGNTAKTMTPTPGFNGVRTAISRDWGVTWTAEITKNISRSGDIDPHVVYLSNGKFRMYLRSARSNGIIAIDGDSPTSFDTTKITTVLKDGASGITMRFDPFVVKYPNGNVVCYTGTDAGAGSMPPSVVGATSIPRTTSVQNDVNAAITFTVAPNPASELVRVHFTLVKSERVQLSLYNTLGQEVAQILDENLPAGNYEKSLDMSHWSLASGTYFVQLNTRHSIPTTIPLQVMR
ncbi:MAG: T9SS type A sorting domain-containing protein [Ignavibacteria bacterium]|nr:T9SS type A sorting domain-containing protein [Ignavibacteria bacterium]